jgi:hypothetical protein
MVLSKLLLIFFCKFTTVTNEKKSHFRENVSPYNTHILSIIVESFAMKTIANIYARFDKPRVPSRVFTNIFEAYE